MVKPAETSGTKPAAKDHYAATTTPRILDIPKATYLCVDGKGAPGGPEFRAAFPALYGVAYTVKMTRKFGGGRDFVMGKLEAQWWGEDEAGGDFSHLKPEDWRWRIMVRVADDVSQTELARAREALRTRGRGEGLDRVYREVVREGRCVQVLHVGPYERETETIEAMKVFAHAEGYELTGRHHEIYLSDPRRVAPERLRTILRIPVARSS